MMQPFDERAVDIRAPRYFIARSMATCPCCGMATPLLALCLPPGHEVLEYDDDASEELDGGVWITMERHVFLFHVHNLPAAAQRRLTELLPSFCFNGDEQTGLEWANHCEHCGHRLLDDALFGEPDGPFLPANEASARRIRLTRIDEVIEAGAAGRADEPEFFGSMCQE